MLLFCVYVSPCALVWVILLIGSYFMYSMSPFQVVEDPNSSISWEMSSCAIFERRSGVCSGPVPWSEFQELMHRLDRQWESNCMTPSVCQGLWWVQNFCFQVFGAWGLIYLESDVLSLHCSTKWFNGYCFYISCSLSNPATFQNWKIIDLSGCQC